MGTKRLKMFQANLAGYMFILPAIILVAVFLIYPIGFVIYISFTKWGILGTPKFVGLDNYIEIFTDPNFWSALGNTIYYMILAVPGQVALGLLLAFLGTKKIFPAAISSAPSFLSRWRCLSWPPGLSLAGF
jgi:ABC-type sugar transport system permease subunit